MSDDFPCFMALWMSFAGAIVLCNVYFVRVYTLHTLFSIAELLSSDDDRIDASAFSMNGAPSSPGQNVDYVFNVLPMSESARKDTYNSNKQSSNNLQQKAKRRSYSTTSTTTNDTSEGEMKPKRSVRDNPAVLLEQSSPKTVDGSTLKKWTEGHDFERDSCMSKNTQTTYTSNNSNNSRDESALSEIEMKKYHISMSGTAVTTKNIDL
eukprot:UN23059